MSMPSLAEGPQVLSRLEFESGGVTIGGAAGFGLVPFGFRGGEHWRDQFCCPDAPAPLELPVEITLDIGPLRTNGAFILSQHGWEHPTHDIEMRPMELRCTYSELVDLFLGVLPLRALVKDGRVLGSPGQLSFLTYAIGCKEWTDWISPLRSALERSKVVVSQMVEDLDLADLGGTHE